LDNTNRQWSRQFATNARMERFARKSKQCALNVLWDIHQKRMALLRALSALQGLQVINAKIVLLECIEETRMTKI
jgi:hypothetical protein